MHLYVLVELYYGDLVQLIYLSQWLEQNFLGYLKAWEKSVEERAGFTKDEKANMLLSPATRLGIFMTCKCTHCLVTDITFSTELSP